MAHSSPSPACFLLLRGILPDYSSPVVLWPLLIYYLLNNLLPSIYYPLKSLLIILLACLLSIFPTKMKDPQEQELFLVSAVALGPGPVLIHNRYIVVIIIVITNMY